MYRVSLSPHRPSFSLRSVRRVPNTCVQASIQLLPPNFPFAPRQDVEHVVSSPSETTQTNPLFSSFSAPSPSVYSMEEDWIYSDFVRDVKEHKIQAVYIRVGSPRARVITTKGDVGFVNLLPTEMLVQEMLDHQVEIHYITEPSKASDVGNSLRSVGDIFFQIFGLIVFFQIIGLLLRMSGGGGPGGGLPFTKNVGKLYDAETDVQITFKDVAGVENAKEDLMEVIDFLKNTEAYTKVGARIPKGVLLVGPPGTGKTLMARAIAGEAQVPFFSCSASEFIELFVGVGASRIRELFKKAKEQAPCILFIDEIDAIGKKRSANPVSSNDERDQTINQLLTEMDGFSNNTGVIMIAATNRPELLDEALLRPGRFDRQVVVDLPNNAGRKQILELYLQNKPTAEDVDIERLAAMTIGFSGAELENLCNEAAIYTARQKRDQISHQTLEYIFDKLTIGAETKTNLITDSKRKIIAYHEAGHALLGALMGDYDVLRKVSIVARGNAGGITFFEPSEDRIDMGLYTREYLENQLVVLMGGRVAEEITFGTMKITTGASNDIERATDIATQMVSLFGFNECIGPLCVSQDEILYSSMGPDVSAEIKTLIDYAYQKARDLLEQNEYYLIRVAKALMEKETLDLEDMNELLSGMTCVIKNSRELREKKIPKKKRSTRIVDIDDFFYGFGEDEEGEDGTPS